MRRIYNVIIMGCVILLAGSLNSCTQPNGYIGDWFGSWHLESLMINGEPDPDYKDNIMVSFQGKIFNFGYIGSVDMYGSWEYEGEVLTLITGYDIGTGATNPNYFNPWPLPMHFPADTDQLEITVTYINGDTMQWQYIDQNDRLLTYNFRKYP